MNPRALTVRKHQTQALLTVISDADSCSRSDMSRVPRRTILRFLPPLPSRSALTRSARFPNPHDHLALACRRSFLVSKAKEKGMSAERLFEHFAPDGEVSKKTAVFLFFCDGSDNNTSSSSVHSRPPVQTSTIGACFRGDATYHTLLTAVAYVCSSQEERSAFILPTGRIHCRTLCRYRREGELSLCHGIAIYYYCVP